ncbi:MAG TPA: response regulator transcription factor [Alteraurantiacibacter sp.]|jgi:DNA-binding response OmpR family regulator
MRIAILEDDLSLANYIEKSLNDGGHSCDLFIDGKQLLRALRRETFDILILDWNVPGLSGHEVLLWMKENLDSSPPALMLSSRSAEEDIVAGLSAGADDYVVKPVAPAVLLARVNALARRAYPPPPPDGIETFGDYLFDMRNEAVEFAGQQIVLTAKEFGLALLLFRNIHRPLSRAYIFEALWGGNPDLSTRTLDAHISNVRTKLNLRPGNGYKLVPIYAYGYRLETHD